MRRRKNIAVPGGMEGRGLGGMKKSGSTKRSSIKRSASSSSQKVRSICRAMFDIDFMLTLNIFLKLNTLTLVSLHWYSLNVSIYSVMSKDNQREHILCECLWKCSSCFKVKLTLPEICVAVQNTTG